MRRDRRFQLLFNRDRVALILDCQVLAYDETFKEIFKGGGK